MIESRDNDTNIIQHGIDKDTDAIQHERDKRRGKRFNTT